MKPILTVPSACLVLLCGCASPGGLQEGPGAARIGAPNPQVDAAVLGPAAQAQRAEIRLPERITLPATYRLVLLDGHLALVRESDSQALEPAPASMRIVTGEIARGELAYQPALLPQELAAQVAANRESSARMDNALEAVMRRSRELSDRALELQAQSQRLAEMLSAAQARVLELEAEARAAKAKAAPPAADAAAPQD
jgi:hypothetical protein